MVTSDLRCTVGVEWWRWHYEEKEDDYCVGGMNEVIIISHEIYDYPG